MTKKRFLSRRLACLLTTALVSLPITINKSFADDTNFDGASPGQTIINAATLDLLDGLALTITGGTVTVAIDVPRADPGISYIMLSGNDAGTAANLTVNNVGAITIASTFNVAIYKFGVLNVQFATANTAPALVTWSGAVDSTGTSTIAVGSATTGGNISFTNAGAALKADTITITGGDHADEDSTLTAGNAITATAITLDDNTGTAKLVLGTAANVTIQGTIDAATTAGEGTVQITAATKTFVGAIGATRAIGTFDIDAAAVFTENVRANVIDVAASTTATFAKNITANTGTVGLTLNTGSVLTLNTGAGTIAADIDGSAANLGRINVTHGTKAFTGVVGGTNGILMLDIDATSTYASNVKALTVDIAAGIGATFAGNITAGTNIILTDATSTLTLSGADATVTGNINAATATDAGIVSVTGDKVTFAGKLGAAVGTNIDKLTIAAGKRAVVTSAGNFVDEIDMGAAAELEISKAVLNGTTVFTNNATAFTDADLLDTTAAKIYIPANLTGNQTLVLFATAANSADMLTNINTSLQDNALSNYVATNATGTYTVTSTNKTASVTASELGVNTNKATALLQARDAAAAANAANTDTSSIDSIFNVLNASGGQSATADTNFANQVSPQTDMITGSTIAAKAVTSGVQNVMASRLASLRSGDAYSTGVVTGNGMAANSGFIQAFGSTVKQEAKGNEFGYDADTTGFAIGVDGKVDGGAVIGISYARSEADVDGKGTGRAQNDITTDSVSLYADYATSGGYIEGSITYGQSENKGSRIINTGGLANTYSSDYDSEQYSFRLSGGVPQSVGNDAFITPFATATISQIKADAYTERSTTANDALRLRVAQDTVDSQVGSIGVKYHQVIKDGNTTFTPEIKVAVNHEFGDAKITTTNTYQGGGASFKNSTDVEKTSGTAGIGLSVASDNITFNISYDVDVKDQYLGHGAQAKLSAKF